MAIFLAEKAIEGIRYAFYLEARLTLNFQFEGLSFITLHSRADLNSIDFIVIW